MTYTIFSLDSHRSAEYSMLSIATAVGWTKLEATISTSNTVELGWTTSTETDELGPYWMAWVQERASFSSNKS